MPPEHVETYKKQDRAKTFDVWQFKLLVNKDVSQDIIDTLHKSCGDNLTQAVDQYHAMEEANRIASASKVQTTTGLENGGGMNDCVEKREAICERDQYYDKEQLRWRFKKPTKSRTSMSLARYVLFVRRVYTERMVYSHTIIQVKGNVLRKALRNIFRGVQGFTLTKAESAELEEPKFFYWARRELELLYQHYDSAGDISSRFEIQAGLEFIQSEWKTTESILQSLLPSSIAFEYLWAIFPPDCLVVGKDSLGGVSMWRARSTQIKRTQNGTLFVIMSEQLDWNGKTMGIVEGSLMIEAFTGTMALEDLPYVPLRYHPRAKLMVQRVLDRSHKKLQYCNKGFEVRETNGLGLSGKSLHYFQGRIVVDPQMMRQEEPDNALVPSLKKSRNASRIWFSDLAKDTEIILEELLRDPDALTVEAAADDSDSSEYLTDSDSEASVPGISRKPKQTVSRTLNREEKLLLSGLIAGYSLSDAKWGAFSVDNVSKIEWDNTIFGSLVMKESLKKILLRLVEAHSSRTSKFDDFVKGKGRGLIGLLLGPPGSGKTLTAEAIAETAHMPLYTVSSGALGSEPGEIYRNLSNMLKLATHWRAVLLLDEADVFLAKRDSKDLKRNAIVSVFLRELEYYQGILLLTTNQAQIIDDAFQSRIHFCHHYRKLDFAARKQIWLNFMDRAKMSTDSVKFQISDDGIDQLANMALNGRQIKNAMSIAVNLSTTDETHTVTADNIIATAETLQNFNFDTDDSCNPPPPENDANLRGTGTPSRSEVVPVPPQAYKKMPPPRPLGPKPTTTQK